MAWSGVGSGTAEAPYQVDTVARLKEVKDFVSAYFLQMNDIDLSSEANWTPLGPSGGPFTGSYDGDDYTIQNLTITGASTYRGLFGYLQGTAKNIKFTGASVSGGNYTGILCGAYGAGSNISGIRVGDATTSGGTITGAETGYGGVCGYWLGGIDNGNVTDCFVHATVNSSKARAGLAFGYTHRNGTMHSIITMGTLNLTGIAYYSGGVAGEWLAANGSKMASLCAINLNSTTADARNGGIGGNENYEKDDCYADNTWTITAGSGYGAFAGYSMATFTGAYFNSEKLATAIGGGGGGGCTGLTTAEMAVQANYTGFDFANDWVMREVPGLGITRPWLKCMTDVLPELASTGNPFFFGGVI